MQTGGAIITAAGYTLAPFTQGTSLALVPVGTAAELVGTGLQIPKMLAEGDYPGVGYAVGSAVLFNEVGEVIDRAKSAGKITKMDNSLLNFVSEMWDKAADIAFDETTRFDKEEEEENR